MSNEDRKRKVANGFDRIKALIEMSRLSEKACARILEQIETEKALVLEVVDCPCAEPKEPRPSGTVDLLHPNGRCICGGSGICDWCKEIVKA